MSEIAELTDEVVELRSVVQETIDTLTGDTTLDIVEERDVAIRQWIRCVRGIGKALVELCDDMAAELREEVTNEAG